MADELILRFPAAFLRAHPVDLGDLPAEIQYQVVGHLLPFAERTVSAHWRTRYSSFLRRRSKEVGERTYGIWVDIKAADQFLDEHGYPLLSEKLIVEKKRKNPTWISARDLLFQAAQVYERETDD